MVTLTGEAVWESVFNTTLELPSLKFSIVPEVGFADAIGIAEKTLKIIRIARLTEREALACARARVRGIGPADNLRGLCRLRRDNQKNSKKRDL